MTELGSRHPARPSTGATTDHGFVEDPTYGVLALLALAGLAAGFVDAVVGAVG